VTFLRVAGRILVYLALWIVLAIVISAVINQFPRQEAIKGFHFAISSLLGGLAANWICMRAFEDTGLREIGLGWNGRNFLVGLAAGVSSALLVTVVPVATGMAEWRMAGEPPASATGVSILLVMYLVAASNEEIGVRGYLFQRLMGSTGLAPAAVLTSILFAAGHLGNPNASRLGIVNTFVAGFMLACAMRASGDLWFPIGMHYSWNTWLTLCGADVSGFTNRLTNYEMVWKVGPLWSGGGYGPEGGILTTLAFSLWAFWAWKGPIERHTPWMLTAGSRVGEETRNPLGLVP
jgi:membrane protease YdiL (CAAX protease family)